MAKKKRKKLENPFVYQGYESPDYFCDRTEETENIFSALQNGRNITLISPRKIGKTGLINHAFYRVREQESDIICIWFIALQTATLFTTDLWDFGSAGYEGKVENCNDKSGGTNNRNPRQRVPRYADRAANCAGNGRSCKCSPASCSCGRRHPLDRVS